MHKYQFWSVLLVYSALSAYGSRWLELNVAQSQMERLISYAPPLALVFEQMKHETLDSSTSDKNEIYLKLIDYQKGWLKTNPYISDIYTMKRTKEGKFIIIVDSETDYDGNGLIEGLRESRTVIGEHFEKEISELNTAMAGQPSFTLNPYTDRWGTWVSAFVPLRDKNGHVDGVFGLDYSAQLFQSEIRKAKSIFWICSVLLYGCLFLIFSFRQRRQDYLRNLDSALKQAQAAAKVKAEFLANMSHEIRTPLNGILGIINLIADQKPQGELKDQIRIMKNCGDNLMNLINDVLDFSKIEAGKINLEAGAFDFHSAIDEVVELLQFQAKQKNLKILVKKKHLPSILHVHADGNRFRQVLVNLLGNAIKFTPKGQVEVEAKIVSQDNDELRIEVSVTDSGIGIDEDSLILLFKSFSQVDASTTKRFGGTGLGLAISKGIVEAMGGQIRAESKIGKGSKFTFNFKARLVGSEKVGALNENNPLPTSGEVVPLTILIADDHSTNRLLAKKFLEKLGYDSDCVANGLEVLDAVDLKKYDVVFMDCQMPEMDGFVATQKIRQRSSLKTEPWIVALTASTFSEDRNKCTKAGMNDFVGKPFNLTALAEAIKRVPKSRSGHRDFELMRSHYKGDEDIMYSCIQSYLTNYEPLVNQISNAIKEQNAEALRTAAHKLRGSITSFFNRELESKLLELEQMGRSQELEKAGHLFKRVCDEIENMSLALKEFLANQAA